MTSARAKLLDAQQRLHDSDAENGKYAMECIQETRQQLFGVRKSHLATVRQIDLEQMLRYYERNTKQHTRPDDAATFANLAHTAKRALVQGDSRYEDYLDALWKLNWTVLWRQDDYVIGRFHALAGQGYASIDRSAFDALVKQGRDAVQKGRINDLRDIVNRLWDLLPNEPTEVTTGGTANILKG